MARYVLSDRGNVTDEDENEEQKKKKKKGSEYVMGDDGIIRLSTQDIAPVKVEHDSFFKSGALEDGYHVGDLSLSLLATAGDTALNVVKGAGSMVEGVTDLLLYGASGLSDLVGADSFADDLKDLAKKSSVNDLLSGAEGITDKYSFFGDKMDSVSQGLGQVGTIILTGGVAGAAGLGAGATTAITTGAMGLSSMGSGMSEAYQANASDEDAFVYGLSKGVIDAGSELIFGGLGKVVNAVGISKGLSSLDDIFAKKLASKLSSQTAKNLVEFGVKASAEGFEEVLAGVGTAAAKHFTYMSDEELSKLLKDEKLLDQFVIGAVTSGISQSGIVPGMKSGSLAEANKTGHDFVTGLTKNEQTVVDKVYADEVAKAEKKGKLSAKEKNKIYDDVLNDLDKGYISTETIEEVLGDRSAYDSLEKESKEFDTLFNTATGQLSKAQQNRLAELEAKNNENPYKDALKNTKEQYSKSVFDMVKGDRLSESYREKDRVYQDFQADFDKYKGTKHEDAARKTLESALKAGANNTNRVHDLVDMAAQISADTGRTFSFKSGEQIKNDFVERQTKVIAEMEKIPAAKRTDEQSKKLADLKDLLAKVQSGETVVNGDITSDGIVLNLDSGKPLNRTVGHEVTHSLENAKSYKELKDSLYAYAKSKGIDIDNELNTRKLMYEGVADADPEAELIADLVGDFLFTDSEYVRKLSTENQNVFQKFWDKIKYLCKVATAGSQEARELARVEKAFADAYREGGKAQSDTKYSISTKTDTDYMDAVNRGDTETAQKMVDEAAKNAGFPVRLLHGTQKFGFTVTDTSLSDDKLSFFATSDVDTAKTYSSLGGKRGISEDADYDSIDEESASHEENARDMADSLADKISRWAGYYGYVDGDYIHDRFRDIVDDYERGRFSADEADSHMYDFADDVIANGYSKDAYDGQEFYEWQESEEAEALYTEVNKTISAYFALADFNLNADRSGNYDLYANTDGLLVIEGNGAKWNDIKSDVLPDITSDEYKKYGYRGHWDKWTTRSVSKYASDNGYRGVLFKNIYDDGGKSSSAVRKPADVYSFFYPQEQVKSADAVTHDDSGNVIPLSERFNAKNDDIRYSMSSMANTFFGDENMTAEQFKKADYRQTQGYKDYVDQCLNNYRQTRADFDEATARKSIEDSIEGIVKVAIAAKQAGYDIYDDSAKRSKKDSKKRLLFSSLEPNSDYFTSNDISTICDKRKNFAEIYDDIVRAEEAKGVPKGKRFFDNVDNYFAIHKIMADKGLTTPCRQCYVESMRKNLAPMANAFLRLVQETNPDNTANDQLYHQKGKQKGEEKTSNAATREFVLSELIAHPEYNMSVNDLTVETLTTADGLAQLKLQAPTIYEAFNSFYGQSKPKMPKGATPFRFGELTALLTDEKGKIKKSVLDKINSTGGFRLQSYSDFQIQNYTDVLQVLFEAGTLGLKGHAYTKVPAFLDATEGTNLKRNISIFMYKDGGQWKLDKNDSFPYDLEEIYDLVKADESGNTGIIAVSQNADMSAWIMANDYVGYGIPFHKSGLKMGTVRDTEVKTEDGRVIKGYSGTIDHTKQQTEVWAKAGDGHKAETKVKKGINIYSFWDFDNKSNLSKNELIEKNVKAYIDQCEMAGYLPKFRAYVMNNGKVLNDVLKYSKELGFVGEDATIEDISFQYKGYTIPYGYYKFLGDFGMFTPDGKASAQKTLSLENYDFDKAVKFFSDSETLRRNEILQQFANGEERQRYRDSDLTAGELQDIVKQKRREVAESVVGDIAPSMSLSNGGEQLAPTSSFDISGKDFRVKDPTQETVSEIESVVPMQETTDEFSTSAPVAISEEETTTDDIAPMIESSEVQEDIDAPEVVAEDIAPAVEVATPKQQPKKPKSNAKGKERKWVGTSTSSDAVDGKILPEDLDQELTHYQPISNKKTLGNANSKLDSMGYETAVAYMSSQFASNKVSLDDIALGERLIQEAVKRGDTKTAGDLIMDISILGTELGQKVQALSIIKRLTPEGQLRMLQRVVDRGKTKGDKAFEGVEITQEMIDYILKTYGEDGTYDQAELNKRVEDVKRQIADKMKVSAMDYINEWRYLSMLGNPKTHIRNMVSNAAMWATRQAKNAVARTIEDIAPIKKRTKTWKRASDDVKAYADQVTAEEYAGESDSKYNESGSIKAKRRIFKTDVANRIAKFNSDALSGEDTFFSKPAFRESFTEYLTANGIRTKADIENNSKLIAEAKQYAMNQAKEATFQQDSYIASKISEVERRNPLLGVAVGSVMPFKKTPINIAKTAAAYSPLGLARNIYDALQVNKGNMEASEAIDHLAQTLTGTALTLLGFAWARAGFLNGAGDDDKEGEYDYQLGEQSYSFNFNGSTFSLSWLSPVAMPLFVGANAYEQFVAKEDWNWNVVTEALAQTLDPLSEMSFLSSLADVLSSYDSGMAAFGGMIESASQSYITSLVPTLSSQIAQVTDDTKRSTKVAANSGWDFGEETWNKIKYKIPGLRQTLEASTDIWGNEVKQADNVLTRAFESFLAPYARREDIATAVDEEIKALYRETGDTGLIPSVPYNYINYDGEKYEMSAEEFTEFKKAYGQTAFDLMEELFATKTYQNAASETRADMVNKVYDYARDEARRAYFADQGVEFTNATKDGKEYYKPNAIKSAIAADMPVDEYVFSRDYPEKYSFFQENGITYQDYASADEEGKRAYTWASENPGKYEMSKAISDDFLTYWQYKTELGDLEGDKDANGKTISGSKKSKVISYINDMDLDYGQKIILFKSEYSSDDTYNYDIIEYLNGRDDISYRQMETILKVLGFNVDAQGNITWD